MDSTAPVTPGRLMPNRKAKTPLKGRFDAPKAKNASKGDRFIPSRSEMNMELAHYALTKENKVEHDIASPAKGNYKKILEDNFLPASGPARILSFKEKAPEQAKGYTNAVTSLYDRNAGPRMPSRTARALPKSAEKVLDCPGLVDDYYLNLLDWSSTNVVAVALGSDVHLYNTEAGVASMLCSLAEDDYVTSLSWSADGRHLAIGTYSHQVQLWDCNRERQVRTLLGHSGRVSALAWNRSTLSTGGRDTSILHHDVRVKEHVQQRLTAHTQEVCGLKWSPSGGQLASGGNDNMLNIWQPGATQPLHRLASHQAAVKALAWCPFQANLLASGGGTADRCIKTWNTHTGAMLHSVDTKSQVCALAWNRHERELLSSHGFSQNQLCLWRYPSMTKIGEMNGHTARALHLAVSPDGARVCSASADETLQIWKCFGDPPKVKKFSGGHSESMLRTASIR